MLIDHSCLVKFLAPIFLEAFETEKSALESCPTSDPCRRIYPVPDKLRSMALKNDVTFATHKIGCSSATLGRFCFADLVCVGVLDPKFPVTYADRASGEGRMAKAATAEVHEIWVWLADEFLAVNEALKSHVDADVVALSQLIQSGTKAATQIRLLGILGRAYIKVGKFGQKYIIFKGYAGLRPNLSGTRYAATNPKVSAFVVGTRDIVEDAAKGTKIAIIAFVAIDIIQELHEDRFSLASLGVRILSDVLQAVVAGAAGAAVGVVLTVVGVPTVVAFVVVVATGFTVGVILTELDRRYKLTEMARARMMAYERGLQERVWSVQRGVRAVGRRIDEAVRQGDEAVREAVAVYFAINRVWRTVEEFLQTGYLIR